MNLLDNELLKSLVVYDWRAPSGAVFRNSKNSDVRRAALLVRRLSY
jgi:hypothetical protein